MKEPLLSNITRISEGIIRVAASVRRNVLRVRLEELALDLLTNFCGENFEFCLRSITALKAFLSLSASIYELETVNKKILVEELDSLESKLRKLNQTDFAEIAHLFKNEHSQLIGKDGQFESANQSVIGNEDRDQSANQLPIELPNVLPVKQSVADSIADQEVDESNAMVSIATAIRQSAILEKIRSLSTRDANGQMMGCKMKDLLATFPDVSERTLRNDLQRLLARGFVERIGTGGATSAYVIK